MTTVGCASEPTRRSTNSMKGQNTSVAVPFELDPPYPAAKQKTCLPLPSVNFSSARVLPWLRDGFSRCAVKEKPAGITAHPTPLAMASLLLGENGTHRNPPTKNGDLKRANPFTLRVKGLAPHRTSRGPSKVPPQCTRPLHHVPGLNRGPPAPLSWSQHAPDFPLSRCTSGPYHLYRCARKKGQPRVQAGTKPGVQALGVVQRPRARLRTSEEPPEGPPPHPKRPSCHYRKTVFPCQCTVL